MLFYVRGDSMKPISIEKRELIIAAKKRGDRQEDIAQWLNISVASVARLWRRYNSKGSVLPTKNTGRPPKLSKADFAKVVDEVRKAPDTTLKELIEKLSLPIKKSQLSRLLIKFGFTFKKSASSKKTAKGRRREKKARMA